MHGEWSEWRTKYERAVFFFFGLEAVLHNELPYGFTPVTSTTHPCGTPFFWENYRARTVAFSISGWSMDLDLGRDDLHMYC
jgi:hypothetical protein